ncbi:MAG: GDSL-type esterase/lipase family protein, partial [Pedobacter sp.]|nr:GDSL-type esterase/lipase family protein [Pedobacter sp.]
AVPQDQSFPYQLAATANVQALKIGKPTIVATTGWTTNELQTAIKSTSLQPKYDIVTLLIGVNNQYRGYSIDTYRTEFKDLLQTAINYAGGNAAHVFVVSIPDWGATPFGKQSGRNVADIAKEIDAFNAVNREETIKRSVSYINITPASRNAATDVTLVAGDGLHPSGKMYQDWAAHILPSVLSVFKK